MSEAAYQCDPCRYAAREVKRVRCEAENRQRNRRRGGAKEHTMWDGRRMRWSSHPLSHDVACSRCERAHKGTLRVAQLQRGETVGLLSAVLVREANRAAKGVVVRPHLPRPRPPETRSWQTHAQNDDRGEGGPGSRTSRPPASTPFRLPLSCRPSPSTFRRCAAAQHRPPP